MQTFTIIAFFVFATTLTILARADSDPCTLVYEACKAKGFVNDDGAPVGKKIYLDCASVLIDQKKAVPEMDFKPNSWEAQNCRNYQVARKKFDAEWTRKHKKPSL
jgi:hypothetical protein